MSDVGCKEWPVPRQPWEVRRECASIARGGGGDGGGGLDADGILGER